MAERMNMTDYIDPYVIYIDWIVQKRVPYSLTQLWHKLKTQIR